MGVVAIKAEPSAKAQFARKIDAAGTGQIGVEIRAGALLAGGSRCGIESETDDVAEAIIEVGGGKTKALTSEKLVETGVIRLAALGAKGGIAWETRIAAERLLKSGLLETLTVGKTCAHVAPEAAAIVQSVDNTGAGDNAGAEGRIGLGAGSGAEGEARKRLPAGVEKASLVVTARVESGDKAGIGVLNFVFVAGGDSAGAERIRGLLLKTGAIELVDGGQQRRIAVGVQRTVFMAAEAMDPVRAVAEIPAEMQEEKLETFELRETGREEKDRPWKAGETGVASGRKAQMIGVAEAVAEVGGETASEERVVGSFAGGWEIVTSAGGRERTKTG